MLIEIIKIFFFNIYLFFFNEDQFYKNILNELALLNIIFVKIFQWLYSEDFIKSKFLKNNLELYTTNCPYSDKDIDYELMKTIEDDYKKNNQNLIINKIPINSGSINLIFISKLDNKSVILKINRKKIKKKIEESIYFFNFLENFKIFDFYNVIKVIQKNHDFLINQINLEYEKNNQLLFIERYKNIDYIKIPEIYNFDKNNNNFILMEYIDALKINDILDKDKEFFSNLITKFSSTYLISKVLHGDLHYGNIMFSIENNVHKLILIDFGIIHELNNKNLNWLYKTSRIPSKKEIIKNIINIDDFHEKEEYKNKSDKIFNLYMKKFYKEELNSNLTITPEDVKNLLYCVNYYNSEIPKVIAAFIVGGLILDSLVKRLTNNDLSTNNRKNINKMFKKLNLE